MKKFFVFAVTIALLTVFVCAAEFETVLQTEFEKIEYLTFYSTGRRIAATDKNGKVALYNIKGEKITADYDFISFAETQGLGLAKRGDKSYIINYNGTEISEFGNNVISFTGAHVILDLGNNNDGRPLTYYEGEFAICDYNGNVLKTLPYKDFVPSRTSSYGFSFASGRLIFEKDGKYGAIGSNFETVIEPIYDAIHGFEGDSYTTVAVKDSKYGIIDYDGNVMLDFDYDGIDPVHENGSVKCYVVQKDGRYGVVSADGREILMELCDYKILFVYTDYSLALVGKENTRADADEYPTLYGLVDYNGNLVVPIEHIAILNVAEGMIAAKKAYDKAGYYDIFGNEVTEFKYRMISDFSGGYAFASSVSDGVWSHEVIDNDGVVLFYTDDFADGFNMGIAYVSGKFIDTNGKTVFVPADKKTTSYASYNSPAKEGFYTVTDGTNYGVIKYTPKKAEALYDYEYIDFYGEVSKIAVHSGGYEFLMKDGTSRYFDFSGKEDNAVRVLNNSIFYEGDKTVIKDTSGKVVKNLDKGEYKSVVQTENIVAVVYDNKVLLIDRAPSDTGTVLALDEGQIIEEFYITDNASKYYNCYYKTTNSKYRIWRSSNEYELVWFLGDRYAAKRGGGWYVVDENGEEINKEPFSVKPEVYEGGGDYCVVGTQVLDKNLNLVLDVGILTVRGFADNKYLICGNGSDELGVIDLDGNTVVDFAKGEVAYLGSGIFKAYRGGAYSVIHSSGRVLASACTYVTELGDNGYIGISTSAFEGYIDKNGKVKITLPYGYYVQGAFSDGMAAVVKNIIYSRYGDVSYINENGEIVISGNNEWCDGGDFENGIAAMGTNLGKAGATGIRLVRCLYDTPSDWAAETVLEAIDIGILKEEHQKRYKKNVTREDFCEIVYELTAVQKALGGVSLDKVTFTDTDNEKVRALSAVGIIFGVGDGKFNPDAFITRKEVATILARVYALENTVPNGDGYVYSDDSLVAEWAKESVYAMRAAGIMVGVDGGRFSPDTMCTTEQTIAAALRLEK